MMQDQLDSHWKNIKLNIYLHISLKIFRFIEYTNSLKFLKPKFLETTVREFFKNLRMEKALLKSTPQLEGMPLHKNLLIADIITN